MWVLVFPQILSLKQAVGVQVVVLMDPAVSFELMEYKISKGIAIF